MRGTKRETIDAENTTTKKKLSAAEQMKERMTQAQAKAILDMLLNYAEVLQSKENDKNLL